MTNRQWINEMSNEELGKYLGTLGNENEYCCYKCCYGEDKQGCDMKHCTGRIAAWLNEEHEYK